MREGVSEDGILIAYFHQFIAKSLMMSLSRNPLLFQLAYLLYTYRLAKTMSFFMNLLPFLAITTIFFSPSPSLRFSFLLSITFYTIAGFAILPERSFMWEFITLKNSPSKLLDSAARSSRLFSEEESSFSGYSSLVLTSCTSSCLMVLTSFRFLRYR